ncbi:MAG: 50S ribosomal protein L6 [Bacilli bacterium]|jgi:large subunit ribosomal protein L6|nr:50S ribosomal protein L6 [Bacilli bacterium]
MSRIGNRVLTIPAGVTVDVADKTITVKGPKGELNYTFDESITAKVDDGKVIVTRANETKQVKSLHGTTNALIANMLTGVSAGYQKVLEAVGVGYKFAVSGKKITVHAGYSHTIEVEVPTDLSVELVSATELNINGIDKQKVSEFAANIRKIRQPEPYKGKGIRYKGEYVRRKEGKKAAK